MELLGSLNLVGGSIEAPKSQNTDLSTEVQTMAANLNQVTNSLVEAHDVIDNYKVAVNKTTIQLETIRENGPTWITAISVVMTVMLVWLAITQVGLLLQGVELIHKQ